MQNTAKKLLSIKNLFKYFPIAKTKLFQREQFYVRANEDISLDIYEGETLGLVGESGCGKSTLGRVLLQLYDQTGGSTMYYGRTVDDLAPRYFAKTLKNAKKYVEIYKKAEAKANALIAECESLGENATFIQLQTRNLAITDMNTKLHNVATILGGCVALENIEEGAAILLKGYRINVKRFQLGNRLTDLAVKHDFVTSKLDAEEKEEKKAKLRAKLDRIAVRSEQTQAELKALDADNDAYRAEIAAFRERYRDNEDFMRYEQMLDDGIDLSRLKTSEMRVLRRDLQIIFQDPYSSLNPRMTVGQIIEEGLVTHKFFKHGSAKLKQYIIDTMTSCGLQDYMVHRYPHQFSGGQRQRICIARSLAVKPKFVVCDECVSALDVSIQSQIINLLQELKEKEKLTYLFISHDLSVVRYISDRICVMYLGNVVELTDSEKIFDDPRHPYTVALLSSIPTTDIDSAEKERIILEGNIPSPIMPPSGCKFHTRCYMACDKCKRVPPPLIEVEPDHFVACHFPERKIDENGNYLFELPKMERKSVKIADGAEDAAQADAQEGAAHEEKAEEATATAVADEKSETAAAVEQDTAEKDASEKEANVTAEEADKADAEEGKDSDVLSEKTKKED